MVLQEQNGGGCMSKTWFFANLSGKSQDKHVWLHVADFIRCLQIYDRENVDQSIEVALWRSVLFTTHLMGLETELLFPGLGEDESGRQKA